MRWKRWTVGAAALTAAVGTGVGVSYASWSAQGTGAGGGGALTAQKLVVTAVSPSGSGDSLYPGGPAGWVYFTVQNPNPYAVNITGLSWGTPVSNNPTACPSSLISVDANAPTSLSVPVAASTTSGALQINNVLDLSKSAPDGCQGVTFTVPVTVTGAQQ
jgi:hypothetical protein